MVPFNLCRVEDRTYSIPLFNRNNQHFNQFNGFSRTFISCCLKITNVVSNGTQHTKPNCLLFLPIHSVNLISLVCYLKSNCITLSSRRINSEVSWCLMSTATFFHFHKSKVTFLPLSSTITEK
jgi:hypothetical protein